MITQLCHSQADTNAIVGFCPSLARLVRNFVNRMQLKQAESICQINKKRHMLNEYHQEMIDGMPLQERLKLGSYRF